MADDINVKDASDTSRTVATDEIAGRNYQIVKLGSTPASDSTTRVGQGQVAATARRLGKGLQ